MQVCEKAHWLFLYYRWKIRLGQTWAKKVSSSGYGPQYEDGHKRDYASSPTNFASSSWKMHNRR